MQKAPARRVVLYPYAQWYFLAAIVVTWVGFARSYFMVLRQTSLAHHIHGACMAGWILLLITEPILYQRGKLDWHRKLGRWGAYGLVPVMCVTALYMIHLELTPATPFPRAVAYELGWLDVWSLFWFAAFVFLAIRYGRQLQLHARFMVCTVVMILPPAVGRALFLLPWVHTFGQMLNTAYLIMAVISLLLILDDWRKGEIRPPYVICLLLHVPMLLAVNFAPTWHLWTRVADWYGLL